MESKFIRKANCCKNCLKRFFPGEHRFLLYLLHRCTQDIVSHVDGNLNRAQKPNNKLLRPAVVTDWKTNKETPINNEHIQMFQLRLFKNVNKCGVCWKYVFIVMFFSFLSLRLDFPHFHILRFWHCNKILFDVFLCKNTKFDQVFSFSF